MEAVRKRHARARNRGARCVLAVEGRLPQREAALTVNPRVVALIPARSGSKRVADKNVAPLAGHPLLAYTIAAARASGVFDAVIVSTDADRYAAIAKHYGADVPALRPSTIAGDRSPDIEWVEHMVGVLDAQGRSFDAFSILRPTSPFRQPDTIRRAWTTFVADPGADSLRAVEPCRQHPGKMWVWRGNRLLPLLPLSPPDQPWHSSQYQALPEVFVQNASLEIAWIRVVRETRTIAGVNIVPFLTLSHEGFDVNQPYDWRLAEELVRLGQAALPVVPQPPYVESPTIAR